MNLKNRLALLAVPAAAAIMFGGAVVAHATSGPAPATQEQGEHQDGDTGQSGETDDVQMGQTGPTGEDQKDQSGDQGDSDKGQIGHNDAQGQNQDHQSEGNE